MRVQRNTLATLLLATCGVLVAAAPALARDRDDAVDRRETRRVVIVGDDGQEATVTLDGSRLRVIATDGDEVQVEEIDLSEIGALVNEAITEAMRGVNDALDHLADHDFSMHVSPERRIRVESDMADLEFDMDEILAEVEASVNEAMRELQRELDSHADRDRHRHERVAPGRVAEDEEMAGLREEIDALQREIRQLRAEIRALDRDR